MFYRTAGYYGYLYSQAFSADMYKTVFERNPMDPALGKAYRDKILGPGGSRSVHFLVHGER